MRVYIAGPMSGLEDLNHPAFNAVADVLRKWGHEVENPADNGSDPDVSWQEYMRRGIRQLLLCDGIALLPGWQHSRGAQLERHIADQLGMEFIEL